MAQMSFAAQPGESDQDLQLRAVRESVKAATGAYPSYLQMATYGQPNRIYTSSDGGKAYNMSVGQMSPAAAPKQGASVYNTALGVLPSPQTQLFGGNAGGQAGTQQANRPPAQGQSAPQQGAPQTFAQMQQQGVARPAPQQFQLGQTFGGSGQADALFSQLQQRLGRMDQQSIYSDPMYQQRRQAAIGNLQAERQASESSLREEMARRGLAASSIAAGRMGDVAGQFARAQATMEADLLKEAMAQEQQRQQFVAQQMGSLFGTVSEQELGAFRANIESAKAQADIQQRAQQMQMEEALRGRELSLQEARDLATAEYQRGQLAQAAADMASRERMQQEGFRFQAGESKLERELRETLQGREQKFQSGQSELERDLREKMQTRELTSAEKRQLAQIDADKEAQERQFSFTEKQNTLDRNIKEAAQMSELTGFQYRVVNGQVVPVLGADGKPVKTSAVSQAEAERQARADLQKDQQKFQRDESALDRAIRERFGMTEATGILYGPDGKPVLGADGKPVQTLAGQQFAAGQTQAQNQFLAQLASVLAPMSQKDRDAFIRNLPPSVRSLFGSSAAGTGAGATGAGAGTYNSGQGEYGNFIP